MASKIPTAATQNKNYIRKKINNNANLAVINFTAKINNNSIFTSLPRSATMPALKVGDLPLPLHRVHADLTCHQNENKHV